MATPAERKALLFLAAVVSLGAGVRVVRATSGAEPDPAAAQAVKDQLRRVDSARNGGRGASRSGGSRRKRIANAVVGPVDVDTASPALIEQLNGIGPALAKRIVANRDSFGAFGSVVGLTRVRGIGPALAARLAPQVTFSGVPRPSNAVLSPPPVRRPVPGRVQQGRGFP